jgi:hypothetical protein
VRGTHLKGVNYEHHANFSANQIRVDSLIAFPYRHRMTVQPVHQKPRLLCAIFAVAIGLSTVSVSFAQQQWLVLNNGQTIEGKVAFENGRYSIETPSGSRIIVTQESTNFVADSIKDIYWEKWSRVDPTDGTSHIRLFRWCLKHGLMDEAQKQIDLVAKVDELDGQAEHLSRMAEELELVVARIEKEALIALKIQQKQDLEIRDLPKLANQENSNFATAPKIPSAPIDSEGRPVRFLGSANAKKMAPAKIPQGKVDLVNFEEEIESSTKRTKPAWVSNRQLDRESRAMPEGTVSFYKRHLERKLIKNCASCHDSRSVAMPMSQRSFGQTIPRRMSQQNLHFIMQQVDRANPLDSPLLKMATNAHGDQNSATFQSSDPFVFDLRKWTIAVSNDPTKWLMQLAQESAPAPKSDETIEDAIDDVITVDLESEPVAKKENATINKVEAEAAPSDPYDPSAFNKQ